MIDELIRAMPKVELHVHLEGAIQPPVLLELAQRNAVDLPYDEVADLESWFQFKNFDHFVEVYIAIAGCIRNGADIELIAREFLRGQARQNVRYSEVIFTPFTHFSLNGRIPFAEQLAALAGARAWAAAELGVQVAWVLDVSRNVRPVDHAMTVAKWAAEGQQHGVVGFGLGGPEVGNPPELFAGAFDFARERGLACLPHAGETCGPESIRGAVDVLRADRLGHGVRCLEDPELVAELRDRQLPLDVCPTSNIRLGVSPSIAEHPLPKLLDEGLFVTLGSDDPALFGTTLNDEYITVARRMGLGFETLEQLVYNGIRASRLPAMEKVSMIDDFRAEIRRLKAEMDADC